MKKYLVVFAVLALAIGYITYSPEPVIAGDKVLVCHDETPDNLTDNNFHLVNVSVNGCLNGHCANHAEDYSEDDGSPLSGSAGDSCDDFNSVVPTCNCST